MWNEPRQLNLAARLLVVLALLIACVAAVAWVVQWPAFALQRVRIESASGTALRHVNGPTIRANVAGKIGGSFFTVDLDAARQAFEAVPWVRHASVRRAWPDELVVAIEEHQVLGIWGAAELGRLVNVQGELFVANLAEAEEEGTLVAMNGPDAAAPEVAAMKAELERWLAPLNAHVVRLELTANYGWSATLSGGMRLELGRDQGSQDHGMLRQRVSRFLAALPQVRQRWGGTIEYADLRYPNGFALRTTDMRFLPDDKAPQAARAQKL